MTQNKQYALKSHLCPKHKNIHKLWAWKCARTATEYDLDSNSSGNSRSCRRALNEWMNWVSGFLLSCNERNGTWATLLGILSSDLQRAFGGVKGKLRKNEKCDSKQSHTARPLCLDFKLMFTCQPRNPPFLLSTPTRLPLFCVIIARTALLPVRPRLNVHPL